jgi:hypothetical protein
LQWFALCKCTPEELNVIDLPMPPIQGPPPNFKFGRRTDGRIVIRKKERNAD